MPLLRAAHPRRSPADACPRCGAREWGFFGAALGYRCVPCERRAITRRPGRAGAPGVSPD